MHCANLRSANYLSFCSSIAQCPMPICARPVSVATVRAFKPSSHRVPCIYYVKWICAIKNMQSPICFLCYPLLWLINDCYLHTYAQGWIVCCLNWSKQTTRRVCLCQRETARYNIWKCKLYRHFTRVQHIWFPIDSIRSAWCCSGTCLP